MTKRRAVKILRIQKEKLKDEKFRNHLWKNQTAAYLKDFFGDSYEKAYCDSIRFNNYPRGDNTDAEMNVINDRYADGIAQFLDNCIESIELKGLHRKGNFLSRIPDNWLIVAIPIILAGVVTVGTLWGKYLSDTQNIELKSENKILKDSLSRTAFAPSQKTNDVPKGVRQDTSRTNN